MQVSGKKKLYEYTDVFCNTPEYIYTRGVNRLRQSAENVWMLLTDGRKIKVSMHAISPK